MFKLYTHAITKTENFLQFSFFFAKQKDWFLIVHNVLCCAELTSWVSGGLLFSNLQGAVCEQVSETTQSGKNVGVPLPINQGQK